MSLNGFVGEDDLPICYMNGVHFCEDCEKCEACKPMPYRGGYPFACFSLGDVEALCGS